MIVLAGRGAGRSLRHAAVAALILVLASGASDVFATPFVPPDDLVILEHLPESGDPGTHALLLLHHELAANPTDLTLALTVARGDLDRSRALGDPRFLGRAEAALAPWPSSADAPPAVLLLRAVILQSNHDFDGALALLRRVLQQRRGDAQAWLTMAAIHQAQGRFHDASADCGQVATLVLGLVPDVCTASAMSMTGHAALALRAVGLSLATNAAEAARAPGVAVWGMTLAAEIAGRIADVSAESWFAHALAIDARDPYLLAAWSDWLLDHDRPQQVITLLRGYTRVDPLLLRLALAEQATGRGSLEAHVSDLQERFAASRLRGDTVHRREEARFELGLLHEPAQALSLARANWDVQREPADARILLETALAAGQAGAAAPVLRWMRENAMEDARLAILAAQLGRR